MAAGEMWLSSFGTWPPKKSEVEKETENEDIDSEVEDLGKNVRDIENNINQFKI